MSYFKIYLTSTNEIAIIQLGECDEIDYNQSRFLSSKKFDTEDQAIQYLNENSDRLPEHIYNPYSSQYFGMLD